MENKVKVWIARDKDGSLYAYSINRPIKFLNCWFSSFSGYLGKSKKFPSVKWEDDEPTEAYITLANEQQPTHGIDWEQRRYEIAKDILQSLVADIVVENVVDDKEMFAKYAINITDTLINELKKQGE